MNYINIDCFAGGGGASTGLEQAGIKIDIAINHDPSAILMHKTNHPDTLHLTEDIFEVDLKKYIKPSDRVGVMWASPDCTSHSRAKGNKPKNGGSRILAWAVYDLCCQIESITGEPPKIVFMENVEEIQKWCPLDENGSPIKEIEGCCYGCFISAMQWNKSSAVDTCDFCKNIDNCLNGSVEKSVEGMEIYPCEEYCRYCQRKYLKGLRFDFKCTTLVAADFGAATTRKRWYAVFRSDGKPIKFPNPTHNKDGSDGLKKWKPVSDFIDWSDLGKSIFDRKKPLCEKTQRRIANGIKKFILEADKPFIVPEKEAAAFLIQYHSEQSEGVRGQSLDRPLQTIDTSNRYALVSALLIKYYNGDNQGQAIDRPLDTLTTRERFGLVSVVIDGEKYTIKDIFLRMLKPEECKLAQGFPADYIIDRDYEGKPYPRAAQMARIGNSVCPPVAKALAEANLIEEV